MLHHSGYTEIHFYLGRHPVHTAVAKQMPQRCLQAGHEFSGTLELVTPSNRGTVSWCRWSHKKQHWGYKPSGPGDHIQTWALNRHQSDLPPLTHGGWELQMRCFKGNGWKPFWKYPANVYNLSGWKQLLISMNKPCFLIGLNTSLASNS